MNHLLQTCKCHWGGGEYHHWGRLLRRRPFATPETTPKFAPDRPIRATHLRLELHLDFAAERARGTTTHQCRVEALEARELSLDAVGLEISQVRLDGRKVAFDYSGEKLVVRFPRAFRRGQTFTVETDHAVTRPAAGLYFTTPDAAYPDRFHTVWSQGQDEDSRYYFPCLDSPSFKQTTEALIFVPEGYFALSNGERIAHKQKAAKGEDLWHYRMDLPCSTYLFSIVAGNFVEHREKAGAVEVRWYAQPGREKEAKNAFGETGKILKFFSDFTGHPYPHNQYTQIAVPDFIFGGMENFTVTTQTDLTLHDNRAHLDFSSNDLVAHEAAHTWFGNLVTARSWSHAWLHESFATYLEGLYTRESLGTEEFDFEMLRDWEAYLYEDGLYRRPIVTNRYEHPIDLFDAHLYPGGAVRLRHLHGLLGEQTFRAVLKRFLAAHSGDVAETVDLARAIEEETGENYDWWFDQWIFRGGFPELEMAFDWNEKEKTARVTLRQTQTPPRGTPKQDVLFRIPAEIAFQVGNRLETRAITLEREEATLLFPLSAKPRMVLFDPEFTLPVKRLSLKVPQDMLLHQLQHAKGAVARIEAARTLAEKPSQTVTKAIGAQLKRESFWGVQQRLAGALARIGGEAARDALLAGLKLPHPKARRAVVQNLGYFKKDEKVARALEQKARQGDESYYVEGEVARALGRAHTPNAQDLVREFLERPSHLETIRSGAFDALGELKAPASLPLLAEGMRYGAPPLSRAAAIRAAGQLGRHHQPLRREVLELLQPLAEQRDNPAGTFRGKMATLRAVGDMGDLEALPLLNRVAGNETDGRIIRMARETARTLREEADKPAEMTALRTDVDSIVKENKALRDRLETLEQKTAPAKGKGKK